MVSVKKHFDEIDIYKGIAILLIIFGHSFCVFPVDFSKTNLISLQDIIGTFNLNMFFIASGILFSLNETWHEFLLKKTRRLIIPWLVFATVALLLKHVFSEFTHSQPGCIFYELLLNVACGKSYWFLYALMLMMVVTMIIKNRMNLAIAGAALLISQYWLNEFVPQYNILCFTRVARFYPWFIAGFLLKGNYQGLTLYVSRWNNNIVMVVAIFMMIISVSTMSLGFNELFVVESILQPIMGCASFWFLSILTKRCELLKELFCYFGKYSLQYYLNHLLIVLPCYYAGALVFKINHTFSLIVIFSLSLLLSAIMLYIEKKNPLLRKLCGIV